MNQILQIRKYFFRIKTKPQPPFSNEENKLKRHLQPQARRHWLNKMGSRKQNHNPFLFSKRKHKSEPLFESNVLFFASKRKFREKTVFKRPGCVSIQSQVFITMDVIGGLSRHEMWPCSKACTSVAVKNFYFYINCI